MAMYTLVLEVARSFGLLSHTYKNRVKYTSKTDVSPTYVALLKTRIQQIEYRLAE